MTKAEASTAPPVSNVRWIVRLICCVGFLDLLAVSMILPLITTRAKELGASALFIGLIGSLYGGIQLFSAPVMGTWSDSKGSKFVLLVTLFATACGYFILGNSALFGLIFSRVIVGLFKHSQSISQTYLAGIASANERSIYYGYFISSSNIGFIIGPTCGGHLAELDNGFFWLGLVVSSIFVINAIIVWQFLPDVKPCRKTPSHATSNTAREHNNHSEHLASPLGVAARVRAYFTELHLEDCWHVLVFRLVLGFSTLVYRSNASLIMQEEYGFTPKHIGYLISYQGVVSAISGFAIGYLTRISRDENVQVMLGVATMFFSLLVLTMSPNIALLVLCLTTLCVSTSFLRVCLTDLMVSRCPKERIGAIVGFGQSVTSVARMLAPLVGGAALEFGTGGPGALGTLTSGIGLALSVYLYAQSTGIPIESKLKTN